MKRTYNLMIGEQTAERIKIEIGSAAPTGEKRSHRGSGAGHDLGPARKTVITSEEIREALQEPVSAIIETVTSTLERAEPELAADLVENGIMLAGGGCLLRGLPIVLQKATGLDVRIADDPLTCVARGHGDLPREHRGVEADPRERHGPVTETPSARARA
jgi:rod shape-determining protein MreB